VAEAEGIVRRTGAEAHLLAFDEAVHEARRLDGGLAGAQGRGAPHRRRHGFRAGAGGGGRLSPSIAVVLTDLDAPFGPAPACPVLWAVPGRGEVAAPPFGRVLRIGEV
jgi:hypothetical protein